MLEEELDAVRARSARRPAPMPSMSQRPAVGVRRLEGVVVALDPGPDDEVRAERAGEVGRLEREPRAPRRGRRRRARRGRRAPKRGSRWRPVQIAVDAVAVERLAHLVEVVGARAPAGSGTRSRRSGRRARRPRGARCSRGRLAAPAPAGSRRARSASTIGPSAQMPRLVFIRLPDSLTAGRCEPAPRERVERDGGEQDRAGDHELRRRSCSRSGRSRSRSTTITSAPSRALFTSPRPPKRLVPPITAAAIASSRIVPPPAFRSTELSRDGEDDAAERRPSRSRS